MSAVDPSFGDDWMKIADAVADMPAREVGPIVHPSLRQHLTDLALELLLREWEKDVEVIDPDVPIPYVVPTDNAPCEGGCGRTVCWCVVACPDTVDQGPCDHGHRLCDECRTVCRDCRDNIVDDYIDGDER